MQQPMMLRAPGAKAWFIWSLSAVAFGYAFFQRVAPSVMVSDLMAEFSIGAAVTGYLSALYFYPYVALQFPLGALLDRFGVRILLAVAVGLAAAGSLLFGAAQSIEIAYVGRFLVGVGSAVGFLASLTLAANWFAPQRFAFFAGLVMFFGMMSGVGAQAPLAALIAQIGWRNAMFAAAGFAAVLSLLIVLFVRDAPPGHAKNMRAHKPNRRSVLPALKSALSNRHVWHVSLVATAMTGPLLAYAGLWGVPYIMVEYDLQRPEAALYVSLMLIGWAASAPAAGWLSDRIGRRKLPLVIAAFAQTALIALLITIPELPLAVTVAVMIMIGLTGATMAICFALARELTEPAIHGSASGIVNALTVASGAILQPIIGLLLDWQWDGTLLEGARVYTPEQFRIAFSSLLVWTVIGAIITLCLRETRCRAVVGAD